MEGQQRQTQGDGGLARGAQAEANGRLEQSPEQDREGEAGEQRRDGECDRGPCPQVLPSPEPPASRSASATTAPTAAMSTGRMPDGRPPGGRRSATATTTSAPIDPAATSATLAVVASPCESAGPTGTPRR